jgi:hypothetical protein
MNMNDYVDVAERIAQLKEAYPEASLQPYNPNKPYDIVQVEGKTYVVYTAACYRDPHDVRHAPRTGWDGPVQPSGVCRLGTVDAGWDVDAGGYVQPFP